MVSGAFFKSDLNKLHSIVQNTMNLHSKELILFSLRDFFSQDTFYRYVTDHYGFAKVVDVTGLPLDAGIHDDLTTRLCIQEAFKMEADFFPALIVKAGSFNSVPLSMNRETGTIKWDFMTFEDGYGNVKKYRIPVSFLQVGFWEGSIAIDVISRDSRSRDDLTDLVSIHFVEVAFNEMVKSGITVTGVSTSGASNAEDRTGQFFKDTVTLKIRTEWRREIPILNIIDQIGLAVDFSGALGHNSAPNLTINTEINILDKLNTL